VTYRRKTVSIQQVVLRQPHRASPRNPARANCASWLSPEQLERAHERHVAAGRTDFEEVDCLCGNHVRRAYR
jgi:hypothetical protein